MDLLGDIEFLEKARHLSEPLAETTQKHKRNSMAAASVAVVLGALDVKTFGFLELCTKDDVQRSAVRGALGLAVVYFFATYLWHFFEDFKRWYALKETLGFATPMQELGMCRGSLDRASLATEAATHTAGMGAEIDNRNLDAAFRGFESAMQSFGEQVEKLTKASRAYRSNYHHLALIRWSRVVVLDMLIPVGLSSLALYKLLPHIPAFVAAIFR